ncbi:MAG: hypothetical protein KME27_11370 [Lyngbya sp. HA4199-MV5]|nr:hypothetical protein [Lyngbya sp. HA4199-MV5]
MLFAPNQQPDPRLTQDADLLRAFNFVPGLKELLMLRQVHALEHATVWVLSSGAKPHQSAATVSDNELLGGISTDRGFYLYGQVNPIELHRAVQVALQRLTAGEWHLAVHPRCGTNLSVGMLLTAGFVLGAAALLPRSPIEQFVGLGVAAATAAHLTPDLGRFAQQYITTAIPFNLAIESITSSKDAIGRPAHFVQVSWKDV